ncbi:MAG: LytTR family DNA-binding domain-containing protein [Cyclobacteriaceae bacterium]
MSRFKKIGSNIIFWVLAALFLWLFISSRSTDSLLVLVFVALLMPITLLTSYVINHYLITKKLMTEKYLEFAVYGIFTVVLSVYIQSILVMLAFAVYADFSYDGIGPVIGNVLYLAVGTYLIILMNTLIFLFKNKTMVSGQAASSVPEGKPTVLQVVANRKNKLIEHGEILYVESMSNYVKIHTLAEVVITKEKISKLAEKLPENFIRIHRSFIVNTAHVTNYGKEQLEINEIQLSISRTYKSAVMEKLSVVS